MKQHLLSLFVFLAFAGASQMGSDSPKAEKNWTVEAEFLKEKLRLRTAEGSHATYNVGFLTLCGSPFLWQEEVISTKGYLRLQPGGGAELALAPDNLLQTCIGSKLGVSFARGEHEKITASLQKSRTGFCRVQGKFIILGADAVPPYLGTILEAKVSEFIAE